MPAPSCLDTSLAVIYTDCVIGYAVEGSENLAQDIRAFQRAYWNYTNESYTGIFNIDEDKRVSEHFKDAGKFHESTYTSAWVKERGTFSPGLLELLRYKGVTHVIVLGLDVVAIAKGAKENGFQTCVLRPATRGLKEESVEELKTAGVLVAESCEQTMESFVHQVVVDGLIRCAVCLDLGLLPRWCPKKMGMFLWLTVARIHLAIDAVISRGFEGTGDDPVISWHKLGGKEPRGYWRCTQKEKRDLLEAIQIADDAGISQEMAVYIYSFTPPLKKSSREKELEAEILELREQLEAKEQAELDAKLDAEAKPELEPETNAP